MNQLFTTHEWWKAILSKMITKQDMSALNRPLSCGSISLSCKAFSDITATSPNFGEIESRLIQIDEHMMCCVCFQIHYSLKKEIQSKLQHIQKVLLSTVIECYAARQIPCSDRSVPVLCTRCLHIVAIPLELYLV